ncbi:hypothetical protein BH10PSE6_BH10PSE6_19780 [soil metagenome]
MGHSIGAAHDPSVADYRATSPRKRREETDHRKLLIPFAFADGFPPWRSRGGAPKGRRGHGPQSKRPSNSGRCRAAAIVSMTLLVSLKTLPFQNRRTR